MSVYEETEDVATGNRVLLFCVGADAQGRREGPNTAVKTRVILRLRGSKVADSPSANNSCRPAHPAGGGWPTLAPASTRIPCACLTPPSA